MESPVVSDSDSDRLSGWKEVAQYLKRGVRTAQRWEKELGLPVRRLKTKNGQVLYARRSELDAWMVAHAASLSEPQGEDDGDAAIGEGDRVVSDVRAEYNGGSSRLAVLVVVGAVAILGASFYFSISAEAISSIRVGAQQIDAIGSSGKVLWTHKLPRDASYRPVPELVEQVDAGHASRVDLTGNGIVDFLVPLRFQIAGQQETASDAMFAFTAEGELLWSIQPDDVRLTFGGVTYKGPWQMLTGHVGGSPDDRRVWIAFAHHTWWPGFVMEVTGDGHQTMRHVQPGWITSLTEWTFDGRPVLVAGGVLNEPGRGSVTLVDLTNPLTVMPAETPKYSSDLVGAPPVRAYTFPLLEVPAAQQQAYTFIHRVRRIGDGLRADVGSFAHVFWSPSGEVAEFSLTDLYWREHEVLGAARVIHHAVPRCREPTQTKDIQTWTPAIGWRSTPFAPVSAKPQRRP